MSEISRTKRKQFHCVCVADDDNYIPVHCHLDLLLSMNPVMNKVEAKTHVSFPPKEN